MSFSKGCALSLVEDKEYFGQCFPSKREKGEQLGFGTTLTNSPWLCQTKFVSREEPRSRENGNIETFSTRPYLGFQESWASEGFK